MAEFIQVSDSDAWDQCLVDFDYFHDSILREAYLVSKGYVTTDHQMYDDTTLDARLIFQSQDENAPAIELLFEGVTEFRFAAMVVFEPTMEFGEGLVRLLLGGATHERRSAIVARALRYRILGPEALGEELAIGSVIES